MAGPIRKANIDAFKRHILPHLDTRTAAYWYGRHGVRRGRRIKRFTNNFYRAGLLGSFIGASHLVARLHGVNPRTFLKANTIEEQRQMFDRELAPLVQSARGALARQPAGIALRARHSTGTI